jgi:hypothetical protein
MASAPAAAAATGGLTAQQVLALAAAQKNSMAVAKTASSTLSTQPMKWPQTMMDLQPINTNAAPHVQHVVLLSTGTPYSNLHMHTLIGFSSSIAMPSFILI